MIHRNRIASLTLAGVLAVAFMLLAVAPAAAGPLYRLQSDVVYGHKMGMALTYDVVEPVNSNGAGVLFMVSGGWMSRWFDPEEAIGRSLAFQGLLDRGFTLFLVRHGSSPLFKVPDAVMDVRQALAHIRTHASDWSVDVDRLGVFGGSAGGHLSLMLGAASEAEVGESGSAKDARVAAVVAYFPPVDLQPIVGPNDRFPALDFDKELGDDVSPLLYVSSDDPPTLLVHGDADDLVPLNNSERILEAFKQKGVTSELIVIPGAGHGFRGDADKQASEALIDWFEKYLTPQQTTSSTGSSQDR